MYQDFNMRNNKIVKFPVKQQYQQTNKHTLQLQIIHL